MRAHVRLAEETLRVLPDILTGKLPATEVMFPDSSFRLVEGIYRNNIISDFFNDKLADTLIAVLRERLERPAGENPHFRNRSRNGRDERRGHEKIETV